MATDKTLPSEECRRKWRDVLDTVHRGGTVTVTRNGVAMAQVVPFAPPPPPADRPACVGDRWGDLTPEQRAGVPVGARVDHPDDPDGGWTKIEDNIWNDAEGRGPVQDDTIVDGRVITHLPTVTK